MDISKESTVHVNISRSHLAEPSRVPEVVALRAQEVYKHLFGGREVIRDRGGLYLTEIVAFLYAYTFPREEWKQRADEAFKGMQGF